MLFFKKGCYMTLIGFACKAKTLPSQVPSSLTGKQPSWSAKTEHCQPGTTRCTPASWNFPVFFLFMCSGKEKMPCQVSQLAVRQQSQRRKTAWTWHSADDKPTDKEGGEVTLWNEQKKKEKTTSKIDLRSYLPKKSKVTVMGETTEVLHMFLLCNQVCVLGK